VTIRLSDGAQEDLRRAILQYEEARTGLGGEFLDERTGHWNSRFGRTTDRTERP
jgi:hypothetical protein